ncbi:MAG: PQQ-binding-like beta-propeller repeat protein [Acidobacteria bacterium]|nr:PQQ-binding-like beta-propeller repeat protein [Acidobacteriota bacterium]
MARTLLLSCCAAPLLLAAVATAADTDWPNYGNDAGNSKYSPLAQIDADNFDRVRVVWTWESVDTQIPNLPDSIRLRSFKAIPVVIDGRMYVSTALGQVAAIDAASGKPLWSYDPQSWEAGRPANMGFHHRGVAIWHKGKKRRVMMATHDRRLLSLDASTGRPDAAFGNYGAVAMTRDLGRKVLESRTTHSSPPAICRDTVIVGSIVVDDHRRRGARPRLSADRHTDE